MQTKKYLITLFKWTFLLLVIYLVFLFYFLYKFKPNQSLPLIKDNSSLFLNKKISLVDALRLTPEEFQKKISGVKIIYILDNKFPKLRALWEGKEIKNIDNPLIQYYIITPDSKIIIIQMSSFEDAQRVFDHIIFNDSQKFPSFQREDIATKQCFLRKESKKIYGHCRENNLIFEFELPKNQSDIIQHIGVLHPYVVSKQLDDLVKIHESSLPEYNAPLSYSFIFLSGDFGFYDVYHHFSCEGLPEIGYRYKPDTLDIINSLDGTVCFAENEDDASNRFKKNLEFLKTTVFPYAVNNLFGTQSIEYIEPIIRVADYNIVGYKSNKIFISRLRFSGNFGSLPQMPYVPPELPTKDTAVYLKYLTKQLYKQLVEKFL